MKKNTALALRLSTRIALGICTAGLLFGLAHKKRESRQIEAARQALHAPLMAYFEEHESYVRLNSAPASKVIRFFELTGHLDHRPVNPATGSRYTLADEEPEILFYETAEDFKTYHWRVRR